MKRVIVLGATGSIGRNALDVIGAHPEDFALVGVSAHTDAAGLARIAADHPAAAVAVEDESAAAAVVFGSGPAFFGPGSSTSLVREIEADVVVNGIAGAAGLRPSFAALQAGADLALANKETVVMAGPLLLAAAAAAGRRVLPVDSEHSAVFHLMEAHGKDSVERIVLTASGGPFRGWTREKLAAVRVEDALAHPTWKMGGKITIDSATLANKGLEVIEAVRLFGVDADRVDVVVHPQSRVHSLVRLRDGSLYAQISEPDMRVPIHNALHWPRVLPCPFGRLDLAGLTLTFEAPDREAFPLLDAAYGAASKSRLYPTAYNAADEVAVAAFRAGRIGFQDIASVVVAVLQADWSGDDGSIAAVEEADARARRHAEGLAAKEFS